MPYLSKTVGKRGNIYVPYGPPYVTLIDGFLSVPLVLISPLLHDGSPWQHTAQTFRGAFSHKDTSPQRMQCSSVKTTLVKPLRTSRQPTQFILYLGEGAFSVHCLKDELLLVQRLPPLYYVKVEHSSVRFFRRGKQKLCMLLPKSDSKQQWAVR